jgi:hypothetical protein
MFDYFIFLDESGDLGEHGTPFFIVVVVQAKEAFPLARIIKKVRQRKLKKKLAELEELKGFNSSPLVRKFVLEEVAKLDCKIYVLAVDKKRINKDLREKSNKLYNYLCRLLCQKVDGTNLKLIVDKKYNNRLLREDFNNYIRRELKLKGKKVDIEHLESRVCSPLQTVDFIAWAANRKFSHNDDSYYALIQRKVMNKGKEIMWEN